MSWPREREKFRWITFKERVSQAYHDYGRLCAAHPKMCLSVSILTMLVLSYPSLTRLQLPASSPIDVFWTQTLDPRNTSLRGPSLPSWISDSSAGYIQQIIVKAAVEPWNSSIMTPEQAVRGPLSTAFKIRDVLYRETDIKEICLLVKNTRKPQSVKSMTSCALFSPADIWNNDVDEFMQEEDVIAKIFQVECDASLCRRHVYLGAPVSHTGIKPRFETNRKRDIEYSITIILARYNEAILNKIRDRISKNFRIVTIPTSDASTFVHVHYHALKKFSDYTPLLASYAVFMIYLYFSSRKFEMVASQWGLSVAAVFTVAATLLMTTGICHHLDMTTTLWGAEVYPYIALILGLQNILCITRSVVYTPPSLDVSSRIAHGLSQEGYRFMKYFFLEQFSLLCGYLTGVSDIQEFCCFSAICVLVDFYMLLFFYVPCLTFDLQRLGHAEKKKFSEMLFMAEIPRLKNYSPVSCPMRKFWPKMFAMKKISKRRLSDSHLDEMFASESRKEHRRTNSTAQRLTEKRKSVDNTITSHRLKFMYFITRTRIFQRTIIVLFAVWAIFLALFVNNRGSWTSPVDIEYEQTVASHRLLSTANLKYIEWQKRTYKWWSPIAHDHNISLNTRHVTFLPPMVFETTISPEDKLLQRVIPVIPAQDSSTVTPTAYEAPVLRSRIDWLERQLRVYLAAFWILLLLTVGSFFIYVCFREEWKFGVRRVKQETENEVSGTRTGSGIKKTLVDMPQVSFTRHGFPIEAVGVCPNNPNQFVSCCQEGRVYVWNSVTGERIHRLNRVRSVSDQDTDSLIRVWCLQLKDDTLVMGCADGAVEIASVSRNKLIGVFTQSPIGVSHIEFSNDYIAVCRLDGTIDFVRIVFEQDHQRLQRIEQIITVRAHQKPICRTIVYNSLEPRLITGSLNRTIKTFNMKTGQLINVLLAHNTPIVNLVADTDSLTLFSSCEDGILCWWNLVTGELLRTVDHNHSGTLRLAVTPTYLLGFYSSAQLCLWDRNTGQLACRVAEASTDIFADSSSASEGDVIVALNANTVATSSGTHVIFWELQRKAIIRQIAVGRTISSIKKLDDSTILCIAGNSMFAVTVPVAKID